MGNRLNDLISRQAAVDGVKTLHDVAWMSVLINGVEMPKECHGCRWFYFQGTSCTEPRYFLNARCELVESGQDWYGKDRRGGWVGESIEHIPGWTGYYSYKHCVEDGTRAKQCPLSEPYERRTDE